MRPYPPLGMLYVSAYLEKYGLDNEIFDTTFSSKAALWDFLAIKKPDILAIYTNLMTKVNVLEIIKKVKEAPGSSHIKIILGGPDITYNQPEYLKGGADFLVIGEGEETMLELSHYILHNKGDS